MPSIRSPIPRGTIDVPILQILLLRPAHSDGIAQRLEQISQSAVPVGQGSLCFALHRLEQKRWLNAAWKQSEAGREARFHSLTTSARREPGVEKNNWARPSGAVPILPHEANR